jgi:penicillin amidase
VGWDGRLPVTWSRGNHRWDGYRDPRFQPRLVDPAEGRIWTANNRVASGSALEIIGDGGYSLGARARQIRDHLRQLDKPTEKDMLAVQLDDRALYLDDWRRLALEVLDRQTSPGDSLRTAFHQVLSEQWTGRAEPASVSYRLAKEFHWICVDVIYELLTARVDQKFEDFRIGWLPHRSGLAWQVLQERPAHLLHPVYDDYDDLILQAIDVTMSRFNSGKESLEEHTWGNARTVKVQHPFVQMVPWLSRWLAAEPVDLPGDSRMPRVQGGRSGASQRMVVSPGREEDGIFHMPGGQSGHPLSPYFLAGHEDWAQGKATPLLPGSPEHELILDPVR